MDIGGLLFYLESQRKVATLYGAVPVAWATPISPAAYRSRSCSSASSPQSWSRAPGRSWSRSSCGSPRGSRAGSGRRRCSQRSHVRPRHRRRCSCPGTHCRFGSNHIHMIRGKKMWFRTSGGNSNHLRAPRLSFFQFLAVSEKEREREGVSVTICSGLHPVRHTMSKVVKNESGLVAMSS